jgi:hypothetical protein
MDIAARGAVPAASDSSPCSSCTKSPMSGLPDVDVPKRPPPPPTCTSLLFSAARLHFSHKLYCQRKCDAV